MKEEWELAYEDRCNGMKMKDIADKYGKSIDTIKSWKRRHWNMKKGAPLKKKKGAPPDNKNAVGNAGGAPPKNQNACKHGLSSKWLPQEVMEIIGEMPKDEIDVLWHQIQLQYAAILRSQKIMWVKNECDNDTSTSDEPYIVRYANDKQETFLRAQSRAMSELRSMIKQYNELLHKNWGTASEIQKAQLAQIQAQTDKLTIAKGDDEQLSKVDKILEEMQRDAERKAG
ncbi:terminase [[Clostridium] innocuum]|uniref:phage terminase small subunit n=1 Tax=Clostridium innocuum TaxID=1522 RepID=UPI001E54D90B|nr:phage terminase small subunit [[Clostridium] innocuum]MCC2836552.1 terminase [[Clostridium] innocuum]